MTVNATLNCNDPFVEESLESEIRDVFASENAKPGKSVLRFIMGYAAAFESIKNEMLGTMEFMNN